MLNDDFWKRQHQIGNQLNGIFTATEIHQQPATWNKTIAQIKNEKEAIANTLSPM